ncbi:MAG: TldD/PmbA family protein, partial [Candidatus Kariarchaeaceae archaeon]
TKTSEISYFKGFASESIPNSPSSYGKLWSIEDKADLVDQVVNAGLEVDQRAQFYGKAETLGFHFVFQNSNSISNFQSVSYNEIKVMSIIEENGIRGYGRESQAERNPEKINIEELTRTATEISRDTISATKIDPGTYSTIVRPQALAELIRYTLFDLEASQYHQGNSAFTDKIGEQLFSNKLTICEDPIGEDMIFKSTFDAEGSIREYRSIIEQGMPKEVFYNLLTANEFLDQENSNGFSVLPYSEYLWGDADPMSLTVNPGEVGETEMIEDIKKGLIVQNLWYGNSVNSRQGIITGLTRDGLFLVEDGEIKGAVKNLRYTDSYLSLFKNIDFISKSTRQLIDEYNGSTVVPTMKLNKLKFVSGTK